MWIEGLEMPSYTHLTKLEISHYTHCDGSVLTFVLIKEGVYWYENIGFSLVICEV
mgnify:CR=1 FL=1